MICNATCSQPACEQTWSEAATKLVQAEPSSVNKMSYSFYKGEGPGENDVLVLDAEVVVVRKEGQGKPKYDTKEKRSVASSRWTSWTA